MMQPQISYADILKMVKLLPTLDKVRLIGQVVPQIERELSDSSAPRQSLRGIWKGLNITNEDIAEVRREMWGSFPRQDV